MNTENKENPERTDTPETAGTAAAETESGKQDPAKEAGKETGQKEAAKEEAKKPETYTFTRAEVEKMEEAVKQAEALKEHFVRQAAEYENYRKRTAREKETLYSDAKADTVKAFLPVYDDLDRAVHQPGGEDSPHKKGLEMIYQKFGEILKSLGVTEIEAQGKPFDPEQHNAVLHVDDKHFGENEVAQVFQAGFRMGDKVIRHATVQVAN